MNAKNQKDAENATSLDPTSPSSEEPSSLRSGDRDYLTWPLASLREETTRLHKAGRLEEALEVQIMTVARSELEHEGRPDLVLNDYRLLSRITYV